MPSVRLSPEHEPEAQVCNLQLTWRTDSSPRGEVCEEKKRGGGGEEKEEKERM